MGWYTLGAVMQFVGYAMIGSLAIVIGSFLRGEQDKYPEVLIALCFTLWSICIIFPEVLTIRLHPHTVDFLLYRIDRSLGLDPLWLVREVNQNGAAREILSLCYRALPAALGIAYATEKSKILLRACALGAVFAFISYNLVPAVGPSRAFADYPFSAASVISTPDGPRNCFPSMQFGWALLLAWNLRNKWLKALAWAFAAITFLATIGLGEHYFVDLAASFPFCYAVQCIAESTRWSKSKEVPSPAD